LQCINIANEFNPQAVFPAPLSSAQLSEFVTNLHSRHVRQCKLCGQTHPGIRLIRIDRVPNKQLLHFKNSLFEGSPLGFGLTSAKATHNTSHRLVNRSSKLPSVSA